MSKYTNSGSYQLVQAKIITNTDSPVELDVSDSIVDIVIFESIFDNCMSGSINIVDTFNMISKYALGHGERILIEWNTSGIDDTILMVGETFELAGPMKINDHTSGYSLQFASVQFVKGIRKKMFTGHLDTPSNITKQIFNSIIDRSPQTNKGLEVDDSRNIENLVFTGQNVWQAISMCSSRATSNQGKCGYLFFENNQSFNFKPIESLYDQDPITEFIYKDDPVYEKVKNAQEEMFNVIQDHEYQEGNKFLDDIEDGQYGSSFGYLALSDKRMNVYGTRASGGIAKNSFRLDKGFNDQYSDRLVIRYSLDHEQSEPFQHQNELKLLKANAVSISVGVFGNSSLKAGDMALVNAPKFSTDAGSSDDIDFISGKMLIASIKHVLNKDSYSQRILLMKDSFEETVN